MFSRLCQRSSHGRLALPGWQPRRAGTPPPAWGRAVAMAYSTLAPAIGGGLTRRTRRLRSNRGNGVRACPETSGRRHGPRIRLKVVPGTIDPVRSLRACSLDVRDVAVSSYGGGRLSLGRDRFNRRARGDRHRPSLSRAMPRGRPPDRARDQAFGRGVRPEGPNLRSPDMQFSRAFLPAAIVAVAPGYAVIEMDVAIAAAQSHGCGDVPLVSVQAASGVCVAPGRSGTSLQ